MGRQVVAGFFRHMSRLIVRNETDMRRLRIIFVRTFQKRDEFPAQVVPINLGDPMAVLEGI